MNDGPSRQMMTDQEMMDDAIASQKLMDANYNNCANEATSSQLRSTFLNLLKDEHEIHAELFAQMQERGWYQVKQADQNQINQTRKKFTNSQLG